MARAGTRRGGTGQPAAPSTCIIAITAAAARGLQGLQEGLQWDVERLSDGISSAAVWGCHHGTHSYRCVLGSGWVCCWGSSR